MQVFSGTTEECLEHYIKSSNFPHDMLQASAEEFFGRENASGILDWMAKERSEKQIPIGVNLIKLRFFIQSLGYSVTEIDILEPEVKNVARLVATSVISQNDLASMLGYKYPDDLTKILRGIRTTSRKKIELMDQIYRSFMRGDLGIKTQGKILAHSNRAENLSCSDSVKREVPNKDTRNTLNKEQVQQIFVGLVQSLIPVAEYLLSDECTAEYRERLRNLIPNHGAFELSRLMNGVCSETARDRLLEESAKANRLKAFQKGR